jgi:hypothetical protein
MQIFPFINIFDNSSQEIIYLFRYCLNSGPERVVKFFFLAAPYLLYDGF